MSIQEYKSYYRREARKYNEYGIDELTRMKSDVNEDLNRSKKVTIICFVIGSIFWITGVGVIATMNFIAIGFCLGIGFIIFIVGVSFLSIFNSRKANLDIIKNVIHSKMQDEEFKTKSKIAIEEIQQMKSYNLDDILTYGSFPFMAGGIYAIHCFKNYVESHIIPIYVGKSVDIWQRWKQHANMLVKVEAGEKNRETKYEKMISYLNYNNLRIEDLRFCVLQKDCSDDNGRLRELEKEWIERVDSRKRGWNSVR
jgi:hypothetical protein